MSEDAPRQPIDWEAIEREYRAGQLSVREIGRRYSVTDGAIRQRAKREKWPRDLSDQVREEVRSELLRSELRSESSREAVRTAAARGVEIVRQHRAMLGKLFSDASRLQDEIGRLLGREISTMSEAELAARAMEILSRTVERQQKLERVAFSLDAPAQDAARTTIVTVAGASLDGLSVDALDAIESAHAALRSAGVIEPQK